MVFLIVKLSCLFYFYNKGTAERINTAETYAVKTAGNLVSFTAEFSACVKFGEYDFYTALLFLWVNTARYSSSVIYNGARTIFVKVYFYMGTVGLLSTNEFLRTLLIQLKQLIITDVTVQDLRLKLQ